VSPSVVKLGSPFTLFVRAVYGDGVEVNLRDHFELGGALEIRRKDSQDSTRADGKHIREWQIELVAWEVGDLQVPPVPVTFTYGGKAAQLDTNATPVRVIAMLGDVDDKNQLRDVAPPTRLLSRDWLLLWISVGIALAIAVLVVYIGWRRSRKKTIRLTGGIAIPRRKIDTPGERALERLLAIEQSGVLDSDDDRKRGYQEMVEVIREYLGARYRVATFDLTSYELMRKLEPVAPPDECALVEAWLERCDIVKYGGLRAARDDAHKVLGDARALVVATQPAVFSPGSSTSTAPSEEAA
jgi:hypothetical protein